MRSFLYVLIVVFLATFKSCSYYDESAGYGENVQEEASFEYPNLAIEKELVELAIGHNYNIEILTGSRDYKVESSDEEVLNVAMVNEAVVLTGVKMGDAVVTVMDNNTGQTKQIIATVNPPYMEFTTDKKSGELLKLIVAGPAGTDVWIDLDGNNKKDNGEQVILETNVKKPVVRNYTVKQKKMRLYGDVTFFVIGDKTKAFKTNKITELDVSHNPSLEILEANTNRIKKLDLSKNMNLKGVWCRDNIIEELKLPESSNLIDIYCGPNRLTTLDVSKNPQLDVLDCDHNLLKELDVTNNTELTELGCSFNQLSTIDLSKNKRLWSLEVQNNQLTDLDVSVLRGIVKRSSGKMEEIGLVQMWANNNKLSCIKVNRAQLEGEHIKTSGLWKKDKKTEYNLNCK